MYSTRGQDNLPSRVDGVGCPTLNVVNPNRLVGTRTEFGEPHAADLKSTQTVVTARETDQDIPWRWSELANSAARDWEPDRLSLRMTDFQSRDQHCAGR